MKEGLNARKITMKKNNRISQTNKKGNSTIKCGLDTKREFYEIRYGGS